MNQTDSKPSDSNFSTTSLSYPFVSDSSFWNMNAQIYSVGMASKAAIWSRKVKTDFAFAGKMTSYSGNKTMICCDSSIDHTF